MIKLEMIRNQKTESDRDEVITFLTNLAEAVADGEITTLVITGFRDDQFIFYTDPDTTVSESNLQLDMAKRFLMDTCFVVEEQADGC